MLQTVLHCTQFSTLAGNHIDGAGCTVLDLIQCGRSGILSHDTGIAQVVDTQTLGAHIADRNGYLVVLVASSTDLQGQTTLASLNQDGICSKIICTCAGRLSNQIIAIFLQIGSQISTACKDKLLLVCSTTDGIGLTVDLQHVASCKSIAKLNACVDGLGGYSYSCVGSLILTSCGQHNVGILSCELKAIT